MQEMTSGENKRKQTNQKKIERMFSEQGIQESSVLWEQLALQVRDYSLVIISKILRSL